MKWSWSECGSRSLKQLNSRRCLKLPLSSGSRNGSTQPAGGCQEAVRVVKDSDLSDSYTDRLGAEYSYIPPLLAVGAVHHLIRSGLRMKASSCQYRQCWSTHHFACLIGYGAAVVCPYLALETVRSWWSDQDTAIYGARENPSDSPEKALENYRTP